MMEEIKGINIPDYMYIDINGLTEIIALDNQLIDILQERLEATISNRDYAQKCLDEQLYKMECHEASKHFEDYMNLPEDGREPDINDDCYPYSEVYDDM